MRRYDDPVEVRRGRVPSLTFHESDGESDREAGLIEGPEQFLWRGRLWKVRRVLARWIETGAWWQSSEVQAALGTDQPEATGRPVGLVGDLLGERELWRVEAGRGGLERDGVFELCFDWTDGRWQLVGCAD